MDKLGDSPDFHHYNQSDIISGPLGWDNTYYGNSVLGSVLREDSKIWVPNNL